ncbi:hypothetical protein D3C85_972950 [compost metagenome]
MISVTCPLRAIWMNALGANTPGCGVSTPSPPMTDRRPSPWLRAGTLKPNSRPPPPAAPTIAASISASRGFGLLAISAAADMICPDWQ